MIRRLKNYLQRTPDSRRYARRNWMQRGLTTVMARLGAGAGAAGVYAASLPDSYWLNGAHPEFDPLHAKFVSGNAANNGVDAVRLWAFILNVKQVLAEKIEGDFAELGVWRGNTAAILAHYAKTAGRDVLLFDTFEGFSAKDLVAVDANKAMAFQDTSVEVARQTVGVNMTHCQYVKGYFPASVDAEAATRNYAVVSLDCDLYEPMRAGLEFFYPRMAPGGIFFLHDYSSLMWDGAAKAIDDFCRAQGEFVVLVPDKSGSAFFRKSRR